MERILGENKSILEQNNKIISYKYMLQTNITIIIHVHSQYLDKI